MNESTLNAANLLDRRIKDLEAAQECFEWKPEGHDTPISLNPQIIIQYDGDGREEQKLPFLIQGKLLDVLKETINTELAQARKEFEELK